MELTAQSLNQSCPYAMPEELTKVRDVAMKLKPSQSMVMIGCGPAVFGVSIMEKRQTAPELWIIDNNARMFGYAEAHFEAAEIFPTLRDRITFVEGDSAQIGREWPKEVDFLIVDGDHSYEGVKADLEAWLPHVPRKSHIFLHDFFERPGGFNGVEAWTEGGCARAIAESIADGQMMAITVVGIGILCERL